jgi:hypothetical protein
MLKHHFRVHYNYASYLLRHKWLVMKFGWQLGLPLLTLLFHDLSKFTVLEWVAYAYNFNGNYAEKEKIRPMFLRAWLSHIHRNPHHWNYWVLIYDGGTYKALPMPLRYILEMAADWMSASVCQGNGEDVRKWYYERADTMLLDPATKNTLELVLKYFYDNNEGRRFFRVLKEVAPL